MTHECKLGPAGLMKVMESRYKSLQTFYFLMKFKRLPHSTVQSFSRIIFWKASLALSMTSFGNVPLLQMQRDALEGHVFDPPGCDLARRL